MNGNNHTYMKADPIHLHKLFGEVNGFFIPEYQRPYTWTEKHVERFFETIEMANNQQENSDYPAFVGALLSITPDIHLQKLYNLDNLESPDVVHILIDGQQRITTILFIISEIYKRLVEYSGTDIFKDYPSLKNQLNSAINNCKDAIFCKNNSIINPPDKCPNCYLPKIIYANTNDVWKKTTSGVYKHPISNYIFNLQNDHKAEINDEAILRIQDTIIDSLDSISGRIAENIQSLINNSEYQSRLKINLGELQKIKESGSEELSQIYTAVSSLILLNTILQKIIFTKIEVTKESYAFDIFDSLNSTGDQLTAFETFKPTVIKYFEIENHSQVSYNNSSEKGFLDRFSKYLDGKDRADRHKITKKYLTSFFYFQNGETVTESTNDQRTLLNKLFKQHEDHASKHEFLKNFDILTEFYEEIWDKNPRDLSGKYDDFSKIALSVFKESKHTIVIPLLARYYESYLYNKNNYYKELNSVIKAAFTFSFIWRLMSGGSTAGIDNAYVSLMNDTICRKRNTLPSVEDLKQLLLEKLKDKYSDDRLKKQNFKSHVSKVQYSSPGKNIWLRFFLAAAAHNSITDIKGAGLDKPGTGNSHPLLIIENWIEKINLLTIEHIIPQRPEKKSDYNPELLHPDTMHSVGNLVLIPKQINSMLGNKSWTEKKRIYNALSQKDPAHRIENLNNEIKTSLKNSTKEIILNSAYLQNLESLSSVEEWTPDLIKKRAERMAELVWDNIKGYLDLP